MSPSVTSQKKRKAAEIDSSQPKEETTAKARKNESGGRKYKKGVLNGMHFWNIRFQLMLSSVVLKNECRIRSNEE